ncbi:hypothetical protein UFOVP370_2 [uncultured Caudovirales phage]|uniref:Uncharacterized protein n=1 Tax=uncultured Caudovirales phage TaxID=2100421 RepID=A0A6J7WZT1_9CAUD|nr:hypothetical protein UFOVP370_2 [uncultured Caudovirales phage]
MATTFDPDAYLAQPPKAFDPDEYLQSLPEVVVVEDRSIPSDFNMAAERSERLPGPRRSLTDIGQGIAEVPGVLATGLFGTLAGNLVGPITSMYEGSFGTPQGVRRAEQIAGNVQQALTYQPRTQTGRDILGGFSSFIDATKLAGLNPATATELAVLSSPVLQQGKLAAGAKLDARAAAQQEANVAKSFENAAKIDASKLAVKYGIILDPSESNPTAINRVTAGAAKSVTNFSKKAAQLNDARFTRMAIEDMGLPTNTVLDSDAIKTALAKHDAAYDAVGKISLVTPDLPALRQIESLRITRAPIGGEKNAAAVNNLVDETLAKVNAGRSGSEINVDIRNLRREAKDIYDAQQKSGVPDSTLIAKADANISIANALEDLIDANAPNAEVLANLRKARTAKAKIFDYERALNNQTNRIDPQVLAKMAKDKKPLSGVAADIAKIASVFPDIAQTGVAGLTPLAQGFARSGAAGTAAAGTAALIGAPIAPFAAGGALAGYFGGGLAANRMLKPGYQAKYAIPSDFRPPVVENNLRPVPMSTDRNLPVPYDYRNSLLTQDQIPNWVFGQNIPEGTLQFGPESQARGTRYTRTGPEPIYTPQLEAPGGASTMRTVEQQRRFDYERQRATEAKAAESQAANEAAGRRPTSGETILDLDPVTGKLRSASQGIKGATLEVVEAPGKALNSAATKVSSGRRFDLTAEEKVAWEKTKVDLAVVDASFAKLSDKALAEKAMDRTWVAETVAKAKQKAAAFAEIEKRSKDAQQVARARAERERLMDALEALEPQLSRSRATSVGEQGPKTREAIRNRLAPQNQNKLRND